jgi:hypothetical protein
MTKLRVAFFPPNFPNVPKKNGQFDGSMDKLRAVIFPAHGAAAKVAGSTQNALLSCRTANEATFEGFQSLFFCRARKEKVPVMVCRNKLTGLQTVVKQ